MPYGRKSPVAFLGEGVTNAISLSGCIVDCAPLDVKEAYKLPAWTKVRTTLGMYTLRCPHGEMYSVAVTDVTISAERDGLRNVSVNMVEVE